MRNAFLIAGASLLVLSACSDNTASNAASDAGNTAAAAEGKVEDTAAAGVGMVAAPNANNTADAYVANAAISDMYEIESSKLALKQSQSPEIKKFAQQMIADHTATTAKVKATVAAEKLKITPPAALDSRRQGMIDNLKGMSGEGFDKAYLDQQTAAHQEALTLHSGYAQDGDNAGLKKLAGEIAPKVQHHYDMVKQLDSAGADEAKK